MSGVEIAGLVLGCLPLIISGIESYNEGLDPVKSFMRWERELPALSRKLRNQHVHYAQTLRILLEPITTDHELAELLSRPGTDLWKDVLLAKKLQNKLQESYLAYQSIITDIENIALKIASKLDLERAAKLSRNDLEALLGANPTTTNGSFHFTKRVRFGMSKRGIKALLEELDECNKELERFTDKSERLQIMRRTTKPSFVARLQRIQRYAVGLHETLTLCWSCACRAEHGVNLQLDPRGFLYSSSSKWDIESSKTCFKVSFLSNQKDATRMWKGQAAEISLVELDEDLMEAPNSRMHKKVSFRGEVPPPYSPLDPFIMRSSLQEVRDLCAAIQRHYKDSPCIGFSFDTSNRLHGILPLDAINADHDMSDLVTLKELLDHPPRIGGKSARLSKKERYQFALTLASSVLQLNATPWLPDGMDAKHITFYRSLGPRPVDVARAYIAAPGAATAATNRNRGRGFQNKNTILLELAVALLELYFGVSAERHQQVEIGGAQLRDNPWTLCAMAYEWAEDEQDNLSAAFSSAVNHCLRCFSDPSASLNDAAFLQAAAECIVLPLQDELHQFLGVSRP